MAFTSQEQDIIKYGVQNGKTRQQVEQALSNFRLGIKPQPAPKPVAATPSYGERVTDKVGTDLSERADKVGAIQARTDTGPVTKAVQTFGQGAGAAANALETTVGEIPGVKQVAKGIGEGINWLATSDLSPIKHLGDLIGSSKTIQEATNLYDTDPSFKDSVDAVANIARLGGDVDSVIEGTNFAKNVTNKIVDKLSVPAEVPTIDDTLPPDGGGGGGGAADTAKTLKGEIVETAPAKIMQRVARLSKGKQVAFETMAGQSVGEYLTQRGIFGNIDKISEQLYKRFTNSVGEADAALEKLPGTFEPEPVRTALKELVARETRVSAPGAESPNLARAQQLLNKLDHQGLDMSEINEAKRLYERNVKVDYLKSVNPEGVARATNIDSSIRKWQFKQAETLGLKNLPEINKETQMAKQLLDDIGQEYSGNAGNNAVTLTDWIMLSGGDPSSVGGFLLKKTLGSKTVQSAIAKYLNRGNEVLGPVGADMGPSEVKQLPAPKEGSAQKGIDIPINHPSPEAIQNGTEVVPHPSEPSISPQLDTIKKSSGNDIVYGEKMQVGDKVSNPIIGDIEIIKGSPTKGKQSGFGLSKIESDHPDVIPRLQEALINARIVEKLPQRTILETTWGSPKMRIIIDHQLGKTPKTFLNNAYYVQQK